MLAFQSNGIDLPIDYEHQNDNPEAKLKGPVPAAGWIKELRAEDSGIWGRVEWTATAAELIGRKEYRYLSPTFLHHKESRQIVRLKGAGLVHSPNLYLTALANQDFAMPPGPHGNDPRKAPAGDTAFAAMIADLLGLPPQTPPEEILKALKAKLSGEPDPAKFVPVATVQAMLTERNLSVATASQERAAQKVDDALRSGHLSPAMREWATSHCRSDEASLTVSSPVQFPSSLTCRGRCPFGSAARFPPDRQSDGGESICSQLGLKPGSLST